MILSKSGNSQNIDNTKDFYTRDTQVSQFYNHLYNYNFELAYSQISDVQGKNANLKQALLLVQYYWWIVIGSGNNASYMDSCELYLEHAETALKSLNKNKPEFAFYHLQIYAYKARLAVINNNLTALVGFLHRLMQDFKQIQHYKNQIPEFEFVTAIYNYAMSYARNNYKMLYPYLIWFPDADSTAGRQTLSKLCQSDNLIIRTESCYFLMRIYFDLESQWQAAADQASKLLGDFPNNLLFRFYALQIQLKLENHQQAKTQRILLNNSTLNNKTLIAPQSRYYHRLATDTNNQVIENE